MGPAQAGCEPDLSVQLQLRGVSSWWATCEGLLCPARERVQCVERKVPATGTAAASS